MQELESKQRSQEVAVAVPSAADGRQTGRTAIPQRGPMGPRPSWWAGLGPSGAAKLLILAGLLSWMYWDHFKRLYSYWQEPDWSHGFLIPVFCIYLINLKRDQLLTAEASGSLWGLALMLFSTITYGLALWAKIGYPQPLTIVTMLAGMVLLMRGWRTLWLTAFPILFLVLAMPPPERLYRALTQPLQQGAAAISTAVLNCFPRADVERQGVNITYWVAGGEQGTFTVAGACSGMRSLMAFVALGLAMAYLTPRPLWHRIAMAVVVVPVALFCNVIRVIVTGALQMYGRHDMAEGTPHMLLGLMTFGLGFVIFLAMLWVIDHVFVEEPDSVLRAGARG